MVIIYIYTGKQAVDLAHYHRTLHRHDPRKKIIRHVSSYYRSCLQFISAENKGVGGVKTTKGGNVFFNYKLVVQYIHQMFTNKIDDKHVGIHRKWTKNKFFINTVVTKIILTSSECN